MGQNCNRNYYIKIKLEKYKKIKKELRKMSKEKKEINHGTISKQYLRATKGGSFHRERYYQLRINYCEEMARYLATGLHRVMDFLSPEAGNHIWRCPFCGKEHISKMEIISNSDSKFKYIRTTHN